MQEKGERVDNKLDVIQEQVSEESLEESTGKETNEDEAYLQRQTMSKQNEAKMLVAKAKAIVTDAEEQVKKCRLLLSDDLQGYDEAKKALYEGGLEESEALLLALGYADNFEEESREEVVVFEAESDIEPMDIKEISDGKFSSLILALISGITVLFGLVYLAAKKSGTPLEFTKLPATGTVESILSTFAALLGMGEDAFMGGMVMLASVLLVTGIVSFVRTNTTARKNLAFSKEQLQEAEAYALLKGDCKIEMDKVDAHMNESISALKTYQVLLNEQKGKLERMLFIEGKKEDVADYHPKSLFEMELTQELINAIQNFISTPMSEEGKLSVKSVELLENAKSKAQEMINRFY